MAIRGLYRYVGAVDLRGSLPTWDPSAFDFEGTEPWPDFGVLSQPLDLFGPEITLEYVPEGATSLDPMHLNDDGTYNLYLGLDAVHAAGHSGDATRWSSHNEPPTRRSLESRVNQT